MKHITAVVSDLADIRSLKCLLPDDVPTGVLAAHLARLMHLPELGPDGHQVVYGLVIRNGDLLDTTAPLDSLDLPEDLSMRLVAEVVAGQSGADQPVHVDPLPETEEIPEPDIRVIEETPLLHDTGLSLRPDIRIDAVVHQEIARFASEDRYRECAGLLMGRIFTEADTRIIHISAMIPAMGAEGTRATVRIPLAAWSAMLRTRDTDYSELRILGWFHSHAGWGVFMSELDVFIHRHFFPHPNMIAYVVDPTTGRDGFFNWQDGKLSLRPSYGLVGSSREISVHKDRARGGRRKFPDLRDAAIVVLAMLVGYLAFLRPVEVRTVEVKPAPPVSAKAVEHRPEAGAGAKAAKSAVEKTVREMDRVYVIAQGDNPWIICNRVYNDGSLSEALLKYNGIDDTQGLQVGQEIKLPPKDVLRKFVNP